MDGNGHEQLVPPGIDVVTMPVEVGDAEVIEVSAAVIAALASGIATVVADFTGTTSCDAAAIRGVLAAARLARANQIAVRLVALDAVARVFGLAGIDQVLPVYPTLDQALTAGPPPRPGSGR